MTKQEQIEKIQEIINDCYVVDSYIAAEGSEGGYIDTEEAAKAIVKAGYGDISGYETEREMLGSLIKVLKQRLNNKYVEIERLKAENERFENNMKNVLKIEKRQAQIDVLKELKTRHDYAIKNMGYPWDISQQIDELIEEVEEQ